ncbi:MAG: hypothetical protein M1591_09315 [Deltaproteobacteria bacterium]|nr:hypothetical protein [Deltaproteobacteria bacterium]
MNLEKEYINYFSDFYDCVKKEFNELNASKEAEGLSSSELAFKDAINSLLPCPVVVVRIKIDVEKYKERKDSVYHLIAYDFANFGDSSIKYYGEFDLDEIEMHGDLLKDLRLNKEYVEELKSFKLLSYGDPDQWYYVWIVPYDILKDRERYISEFRTSFLTSFSDKILQEYEKRIDYNSKYDLKNDSIISLSELLRKNNIFTNIPDEAVIKSLQKNVCDIQLIPIVPEEARNVFDTAKRIFIFGCFDYYFFTVSKHYAFLALESALRNKYKDVYGEPRGFVSLDEIIRELVKKGIIPKGEAKVYDAGRQLRNSLSHLTKQSIMTPDSRVLKNIAYLINQIYDN